MPRFLVPRLSPVRSLLAVPGAFAERLTTSPDMRLAVRLLEVGLALLAVRRVVSVATIFASRLSYPIDLEWCEGGSLYMAWRLLHHLPIYVQPGDVFAPFPYPPGHTLALALSGAIAGGLDYAPARAVSIAWFVVMCAALLVAVRRQFSDRVQGLVAAVATVGLVACSFPYTGGWFDLVRVDSMMLSSSVLAAVLVSAPRLGPTRIVAAALALTVSVYTKQTAAFFAAWICVYAIVRNWREGLKLTVAALAFCGVALAALDVLTRGRFWFWMFENLASHPMEWHQVVDGLQIVNRFAPFALALPLVFAGLVWTRRSSSATWLWLGMAVVALPAALLPYAKNGGWKNDLIPVVVLAIPAAVMMAADVLRTSQRWNVVLRTAFVVATGGFILVRPIDVAAYVPNANQWQAARNLNTLVQSLQGGVLMPQLAFTPARNGQTNPHWHRMGHADLNWGNHRVDEDWSVVRAQAKYALLNRFDNGDFARAIHRRYRLVAGLAPEQRVHMLTGGGVVDLDQLWEKLPEPGAAPAER